MHKKQGLRREEAPSASGQEKPSGDSRAVAVAVTPPTSVASGKVPTSAAPSAPSSSMTSGLPPVATSAQATAARSSAHLQRSASQFQVPCPFCARQVSTRGQHLVQHIKTCRPGFLEKYPRALALSMPQLFRACWTLMRPNQPVPAFVSPTSAGSSSPRSRTGVTQPGASPGRGAKSYVMTPPPAGVGPSYSDAEVTRARAWEDSTCGQDLAPHIAAILPPPVLKEGSIPAYQNQVRMTQVEFNEIGKILWD